MRKQIDRTPRTIVPLLLFLCVSSAPAQAGPCASEIDKVQAEVDAKIDSIAGSGRTGSESQAALLHRQPTPASIARAEAVLDESEGARHALAALSVARKANAEGNESDCARALAEARAAITR